MNDKICYVICIIFVSLYYNITVITDYLKLIIIICILLTQYSLVLIQLLNTYSFFNIHIYFKMAPKSIFSKTIEYLLKI